MKKKTKKIIDKIETRDNVILGLHNQIRLLGEDIKLLKQFIDENFESTKGEFDKWIERKKRDWK